MLGPQKVMLFGEMIEILKLGLDWMWVMEACV